MPLDLEHDGVLVVLIDSLVRRNKRINLKHRLLLDRIYDNLRLSLSLLGIFHFQSRLRTIHF